MFILMRVGIIEIYTFTRCNLMISTMIYNNFKRNNIHQQTSSACRENAVPSANQLRTTKLKK